MMTDVEPRDRVLPCMTIKGWTAHDQCEELYRNARDAKPDGMNVEIGCFLGRSTAAICMGLEDRGAGDMLMIADPFKANNDVKLECEMRKFYRPPEQIFRDNMKRLGINDFILFGRRSDHPEFRAQIHAPVRFAFLDGDHSYGVVVEELRWLTPLLVSGSIVVLDDYGIGEPDWGVRRAYEETLKPRVKREWRTKLDRSLHVEVE